MPASAGMTVKPASDSCSLLCQPFGGPLAGFSHGNGSSRIQDYDQDGRVTKIHGNTYSPQNLSYSYNSNDLITGIANSKNTATSQTYAYNAMSELSTATASATGTHSWQYDANGNRTAHTWGGGTDTYTGVAGSNRLASLAGPRARTLDHDVLGNLRFETRGGVTVERRYNGYGRLVELIRPSTQSLSQPNGSTLSLPAGTWRYTVNALGQRVVKQDVAANSKRRYVYGPGSQLLGETHANSATLDTIYVWLGGLPVGMIRSNQVYAVHADHLGRPEVLTSPGKAVVWRANNLAFDRAVTTDSVGGLNLGFPGQYWDAEAGTWYNVMRDYDAGTGRYTSSDPIGLQGGLNTYGYAAANAVNNIDPLGEEVILASVCLIGDALYNLYGYYKGTQLPDTTKALMSQLKKIDEEIENCPIEDDQRFIELLEQRLDVSEKLIKDLERHAKANSLTSLENATTSLGWAAICGVLALIPLP